LRVYRTREKRLAHALQYHSPSRLIINYQSKAFTISSSSDWRHHTVVSRYTADISKMLPGFRLTPRDRVSTLSWIKRQKIRFLRARYIKCVQSVRCARACEFYEGAKRGANVVFSEWTQTNLTKSRVSMNGGGDRRAVYSSAYVCVGRLWSVGGRADGRLGGIHFPRV